MKKLSILLLALSICSFAKAQEIDLGIKVGATYSELRDADNLDNRTGLLAGVFAGVKFDRWGIQPELLYSQQGGNSDFGDYHIDYINIPVLFKLYLIGDMVNLQAGPQIGFVANEDFPALETIETSLKTKDVDVSGAIGLGVEIPFGLRLDARYNFGFTDTLEQIDSKNSVISVAIGYSFL